MRGGVERVGLMKDSIQQPTPHMNLHSNARLTLKCRGALVEAVVAERDAQSGDDVEEEEQGDLEPVETVVPEIKRHRGEGQSVDDGKEDTRRPVDAIPRDAREERVGHGVWVRA